MRRRCGVMLIPLALVLVSGCKQPPPPAAPAFDAALAAPVPKVELPERGVGMDDPFARLKPESVKGLNAGYIAMRARKHDEARAAFAALVAAQPDHTTGRYLELHAAALAGQSDKVPPLWAELLVRDFVAYAGRLEKAKELTSLRMAPEWPKLRAIEE